MKSLFLLILCFIICYIHLTTSKSSTTKVKNKNVDDHSEKEKKFNKNPMDNSKTKDPKSKKSLNIRTPFDKVLEKLSNCAVTSTISPSISEVMETNLIELLIDNQYASLFHAAPHTAAYLKKKNKDSSKFITGLHQALHADWSNPAWKSYKEIDKLFQPLKQQFVYTMMRFNCT